MKRFIDRAGKMNAFVLILLLGVVIFLIAVGLVLFDGVYIQ